MYTCPLAMSDGAAYLIKHKLEKDPELGEVFLRLIENNSDRF